MDLAAAVHLATTVRTWTVRAAYADSGTDAGLATAAECAATARALLPELAAALGPAVRAANAERVLDATQDGSAKLRVPKAAKAKKGLHESDSLAPR